MFPQEMREGGMAFYSGTDAPTTLITCNENSYNYEKMPYIGHYGTVGSTIWIRVWERGNNSQGTFAIAAINAHRPILNYLSASSFYQTKEKTVQFYGYNTSFEGGVSTIKIGKDNNVLTPVNYTVVNNTTIDVTLNFSTSYASNSYYDITITTATDGVLVKRDGIFLKDNTPQIVYLNESSLPASGKPYSFTVKTVFTNFVQGEVSVTLTNGINTLNAKNVYVKSADSLLIIFNAPTNQPTGYYTMNVKGKTDGLIGNSQGISIIDRYIKSYTPSMLYQGSEASLTIVSNNLTLNTNTYSYLISKDGSWYYAGSPIILNSSTMVMKHQIYDYMKQGEYGYYIYNGSNSIQEYNVLTVNIQPIPVNDDVCSATPLTVSTQCNLFTLTLGGSSPSNTNGAPSCYGSVPKDTWYSFTVPASGQIHGESFAKYTNNTGFALYTGTCSSLTVIDCVTSYSGGSMAGFDIPNLTPGKTIFMRAWSENSNVGDFDFCLTNALKASITNFNAYDYNSVFQSDITTFNVIGQYSHFKTGNITGILLTSTYSTASVWATGFYASDETHVWFSVNFPISLPTGYYNLKIYTSTDGEIVMNNATYLNNYVQPYVYSYNPSKTSRHKKSESFYTYGYRTKFLSGVSAVYLQKDNNRLDASSYTVNSNTYIYNIIFTFNTLTPTGDYYLHVIDNLSGESSGTTPITIKNTNIVSIQPNQIMLGQATNVNVIMEESKLDFQNFGTSYTTLNNFSLYPTAVSPLSNTNFTAIYTPGSSLGTALVSMSYYDAEVGWLTKDDAVTFVANNVLPTNDNPCDAKTLTLQNEETFEIFSNSGATSTPTIANPNCGSNFNTDVWFKATVPASGSLFINTSKYGNNLVSIALYTGTCSSLSITACDQNSNTIGSGMITKTGLTPGSVVYIRTWTISGYSTGTFGIVTMATKPTPTLISFSPTTITANPYIYAYFLLKLNHSTYGTYPTVKIGNQNNTYTLNNNNMYENTSLVEYYFYTGSNGMQVGMYDVTITSAQLGTQIVKNLEVKASVNTPYINRFITNTGKQGTEVQLQITAQNSCGFAYDNSNTKAYLGLGTEIYELNITNKTYSDIYSRFVVPKNATIGKYDVTITTSSCKAIGKAMFTVLKNNANIATTSASALVGQSVSLNITGTNTHFDAQTSAKLVLNNATISSTSIVINSSTSMTANFTIPSNQTIGAYDLYVLSISDGNLISDKAFTVKPLPILNNATITAAKTGETINVTLNGFGTNFASAANTVYLNGAVRINATQVTVISPTSLSVQITIPENASAGDYTWNVENSVDGTLVSTFKLAVKVASKIINVSPMNAKKGETVVLTINGQNAHYTKGVNSVYLQGTPRMTATDVTVTNDNLLMAKFVISASQATGTYTVQISNLEDGITSFAPAFTISGTSGIDSENALTMEMYPNPAQNELYIRSNETISDVTLIDANGKVLKINKTSDRNGTIRVELNGVTKGFYFVRITNNKTNFITKPLVIE